MTSTVHIAIIVAAFIIDIKHVQLLKKKSKTDVLRQTAMQILHDVYIAAEWHTVKTMHEWKVLWISINCSPHVPVGTLLSTNIQLIIITLNIQTTCRLWYGNVAPNYTSFIYIYIYTTIIFSQDTEINSCLGLSAAFSQQFY